MTRRVQVCMHVGMHVCMHVCMYLWLVCACVRVLLTNHPLLPFGTRRYNGSETGRYTCRPQQCPCIISLGAPIST